MMIIKCINATKHIRLHNTYTWTHRHTLCLKTSSSGVAGRPYNALCLSVVSFNSVILRAESRYYCYLGFRFITRTIKCCSVAFGVTLRLLVINISSSFPAINKLRCLAATSVTNLPRSVAAECIALGGRTVHSTRWSQILADNRDLCLPHLHSMPP